jgi:SSS family solute:Na+ symporter
MTETNTLPFGPGAFIVVGIYIASLLAIGAYAWSKRQNETLSDFYLAGRDMGFFVLLLTLYATQYSGNTFLGFTGAAYRNGLSFLVCVHFMTAVIVGYVVFAPRLYRLSRQQKFITPGDYIFFRYKSDFLRILITLIMVFALCNFTLAQMKTLGTAFEGISQGRIPMWIGVIGMTLVMLIYESLGGMRSVAWTDAVQGGILVIGFLLLSYLALTQIGSLPDAVAKLAANPDTLHKVQPPDGDGARYWISFVLLVGLAISIYPQAIQRIYAARNVLTLKRSLAVMAFVPLTTGLVAVLIGVLMAAHVPGLDMQAMPDGTTKTIVPSETVLTILCLQVMQASEFGYWVVVFIFSALLAAVMSTTDSALLSIGSMLTRDIYGPYIRPQAGQAELTRVGKYAAWFLMVPIVWIALGYQGTLIQLLSIKLELLVQCAPAIMLGLHCPKLDTRTVILAILAGILLTFGLTWAGDLGLADSNIRKVAGFHSGIIGLALNIGICVIGIMRNRKNPASPAV